VSIQKKVRDDVARQGFHVVMVAAGDPGEPPFAYTIGLTRTFKHPEILVVGLETHTSHPMLNTLGERIRGGEVFAAGATIRDLLEDHACRIDRVDALWVPEYVGQALAFYDPEPVTVLQCLWPDLAERFPSDDDFAEALRFRQPHLASTWHFRDPRNVAVFTQAHVIDKTRPVLFVSHDEDDGAWQFLSGDDVVEADGRLVALEEMVRLDPSLALVASLPLGWTAERAAVDEPWERRPAAA
jgi:hypothetical protein